MTSARSWRAGLALVGVYAVAAVATHRLALDGTRPLFDGFAPRAPYRWVKPPPELAAGNMPPQPVERTIPLGAQGNDPANASTADAQFIVTLPSSAVAAHPPDTALGLKVTPLDAGTLGPLPPERTIVSNAYQVEIAYQPSQEAVTQVAASATVALTANSLGDVLLYSPDGQAWQEINSRAFGATDGLTGQFRGAGYYLITASPKATASTTIAPSPGKATSGSPVVAIVVAVFAGAAVFGVMLVLRGGKAAREDQPARRGGAPARGKGRRSHGRRKPRGGGTRRRP